MITGRACSQGNPQEIQGQNGPKNEKGTYELALMLVVANLAKKWLKPWHMGTHMLKSTQWELSNEYHHDRIEMAFQESLRPCALDESSLSIGLVN